MRFWQKGLGVNGLIHNFESVFFFSINKAEKKWQGLNYWVFVSPGNNPRNEENFSTENFLVILLKRRIKWFTFNPNENGKRDESESINCFFSH